MNNNIASNKMNSRGFYTYALSLKIQAVKLTSVEHLVLGACRHIFVLFDAANVFPSPLTELARKFPELLQISRHYSSYIRNGFLQHRHIVCTFVGGRDFIRFNSDYSL